MPVHIPVDWIIIFFCFIFLYYFFLYIFSQHSPNYQPSDLKKWGFIILIPACNEAIVIADTIKRAATLKGRIHIVAINDGSHDETGEIIRKLASKNIHLLTRRYPNARNGKGHALNAAFFTVRR